MNSPIYLGVCVSCDTVASSHSVVRSKDWFFGVIMTSENVVPLRAPSKQRKPISGDVAPGSLMLELLPSWELSLGSENKAPLTIVSYTKTIKAFTHWLVARGYPVDIEHVTHEMIREFLLASIESSSPGNADKHRRNLSVWWKWLVAEDELQSANPMDRVGKIKVAAKDHPVFSDDELRALLKTCSGKSFTERRDHALMRIFFDNGARVSGLAGLRYTPQDPDTNDVFLSQFRLRIILKGGREIQVPIGRKAAAALDRYIRARNKHPGHASPYLWLPDRMLYNGKGELRLAEAGIAQMLRRRGAQAGIPDCHPHKFRRTMATNWDGDALQLMRIGGWESLEMVRLYTRARAEENARKAHMELSPGDRI